MATATVAPTITPTTQWMLVTKEMAEHWLSTANTRNRKLYGKVVDRYAAEIHQGWKRSHQGIAFDIYGNLIDGQHRLAAIVQTGVAIWLLVTTGLPTDTRDVIDTGKGRNVVDMATLDGRRVTALDIATARAMLDRGATNKSKATNRELMAFYDQHAKAIAFAIDTTSGKVRGITQAVIYAVCARAAYTCDNEHIARFMRSLVGGFGVDLTDPAVVLRNYLVRVAESGRVSERVDRTTIYRKTERALYASLRGEPLKKLYEADRELFLLPGEKD